MREESCGDVLQGPIARFGPLPWQPPSTTTSKEELPSRKLTSIPNIAAIHK
jgi:hypothetical protein